MALKLKNRLTHLIVRSIAGNVTEHVVIYSYDIENNVFVFTLKITASSKCDANCQRTM